MPVSRHIRLRRFGALIAGRVGVLVGAAISLRSPCFSVAGLVLAIFRWFFLGSLRLALVIGSRPHSFAAYFCILLVCGHSRECPVRGVRDLGYRLAARVRGGPILNLCRGERSRLVDFLP